MSSPYNQLVDAPGAHPETPQALGAGTCGMSGAGQNFAAQPNVPSETRAQQGVLSICA